MPNSSTSMTIPNLVGLQMYYIPPEIVDPEATPIYHNWDSSIIIDEVNNRTEYDASTNPDNVLIYSWNMEYQEGFSYQTEYLTIEAIQNSSIGFLNLNLGHLSVNLQYSTDKKTWTTWDYANDVLSINAGDKIYLKGNNPNGFSTGTDYNYTYPDSLGTDSKTEKCQFNMNTGQVSIYGNIMSLMYGDNFKRVFTLPCDYTFYGLFEYDSLLGNTKYYNTAILDISNLILPATTLTAHCYSDMFRGCTSLTDLSGFVLPAITLAQYCYSDMFRGCTSLTDLPELPATTLADRCYYYMFYNCTSLTDLSDYELPATTMATRCYYYMFGNCTSLTAAPELHGTAMADYCYAHMFRYCSSLTDLPELPATTLANWCYDYMFGNCTSLTDLPELPATALAEACYISMFRGCTGLTDLSGFDLPATTMADNSYEEMFRGCTGLTDLSGFDLPATTLATGCYISMFRDCTSLMTAPALSATSLDYACYTQMFYGCTSLVVVPVLPATTLSLYCYNGMFSGCTSLTTAPVLPATTLALYCYNGMFRGCTSLNYIKAMFTSIPDNFTTSGWVDGVSSTGTFVMNSGAIWDPEDYRGVNGVPNDWSIQYASS